MKMDPNDEFMREMLGEETRLDGLILPPGYGKAEIVEDENEPEKTDKITIKVKYTILEGSSIANAFADIDVEDVVPLDYVELQDEPAVSFLIKVREGFLAPYTAYYAAKVQDLTDAGYVHYVMTGDKLRDEALFLQRSAEKRERHRSAGDAAARKGGWFRSVFDAVKNGLRRDDER